MGRAVDWAVTTLRAAGFDSVWTEPVTVPVWTRGREWARCTAPAPFDMQLLGLGLSDGTGPDGIEAEVIDPRTLRPLDLDTILESVKKTNRAVIVEEGWPHGGVGANLSTLITEQAFDWLDAPIQRVTGADVHMPYSRRMEQAAIPHEENIIEAVLAATKGSR